MGMTEAREFIRKSLKEHADEAVDLLAQFMEKLDAEASAEELDDTAVEMAAVLMTISTIIRMVGYPK